MQTTIQAINALTPATHRFVRPAVRPKNPVRFIGGRLRRPENGIDHLLFGVSKEGK